MAEVIKNPDSIEKILEKIKKSLNLAADKSNEHESAVAASMAAKLMKKYNISMAEVIEADLNKNKDNIISDNLTSWEYKKKFPDWVTTLATEITKIFDCKIRYKVKENNYLTLEILGYTSDVEVSKFVFTFLLNRIDRLSVERREEFNIPKSDRTSWSRSYCLGLVHSIIKEVEKLYNTKKPITTSSGTSLVVLKEKAIEEKFGKINYNTRDTDGDSAYYIGRADSNKIELMKAVKDESEETLKIEG